MPGHEGADRRLELNSRTKGHYDMTARLHDMDDDGIAAAVIFHGSQSAELFPFGSNGVFDYRSTLKDRELTNIGIRMYNRWLADACTLEPARHIGLAHVLIRDPQATPAEIQ